MSRVLPKRISLASILILLCTFFGSPARPAYAANGVAQLEIKTQTPIKSITVIGRNLTNDALIWEQDYGYGSSITSVKIEGWWWRITWTCDWFLFGCGNDNPAPEQAAPIVWIQYVDDQSESKQCIPEKIGRADDWTVCEFSTTPIGLALDAERPGVRLYRQNYERFVQVVNLGAGAAVNLLYAPIVDSGIGVGASGGSNPSFGRQSLREAWDTFSSPRKFCITNGQFFADFPDWSQPTSLAFPLKAAPPIPGGPILSTGSANATDEYQGPGEKLMLEIWSNKARISGYSWDAFKLSDAPRIIVGLAEFANKGINEAVPRTFVGVRDANLDGVLETVLIFNSIGDTQGDAATILRAFGATQIMMLDGGGSSQLICNGDNLLVSPRPIPQTVAVSAGTAGGGSGGLTHNTTLFPGKSEEFVVNVSTNMARFFMASSRSDVLMTLTAPSGRVIDAGTIAPDVLHDRSTTFEQYMLLNPEQGKWLIALYSMAPSSATEGAPQGEAVAFTLSTEDAPAPARPALAYVDQDGRLVLNTGSEERRSARLANIEVTNEAFAVTQLSRDLPGQFAVTAFGITQVYNGVSQIVANAADGDDIVALLAGVDEAGVPVPFSAPAQIDGGEGDDQLQGGDGADTLTGGDGDDVINGGGGDDEISGGDGSDTLNGEAGFDLLNGDPTDALIAGGTEVWRLWPPRDDRRCQICE